MTEPYFIKVPCNITKEKKSLACDFIKKKYDYEAKKLSDFCVNKSTKAILLPDGYWKLADKIELLKLTKKIITIGGDSSLCLSTIPQLNNSYENLQVIFITECQKINNQFLKTNITIYNLIVPYLLGKKVPIQFKKNKCLSSEQISFFGIDDENYDIDDLLKYNIDFFTQKKINQIGIKEIIEIIKNKINKKPVHIVLDLTIFLKDSDIQTNILELIKDLKDNIVSMDIIHQTEILEKDIKICSEYGKECIKECFDIKEKKVNIFTEDSPFIIYRPMDQKDPFSDIGWYILRGIDAHTREQLLNSIEDNQIISMNVENEDYLITKTTINDQNEKSYYHAKTINDTTLFPNEKVEMGFELINL